MKNYNYQSVGKVTHDELVQVKTALHQREVGKKIYRMTWLIPITLLFLSLETNYLIFSPPLVIKNIIQILLSGLEIIIAFMILIDTFLCSMLMLDEDNCVQWLWSYFTKITKSLIFCVMVYVFILYISDSINLSKKAIVLLILISIVMANWIDHLVQNIIHYSSTHPNLVPTLVTVISGIIGGIVGYFLKK